MIDGAKTANDHFDEMARAMEGMAVHEATVTQITTLAVEYEAKTITAERFAVRVCDILRRGYSKFVKQ